MHSEPRFGLRKEQAPGQGDEALVKGKERDGQGEARRGMFRIEACADRRGQITDHGFRDAVKPEGDGRSAQAVLQNADGHAEKQTCGRIPPAQAEVNVNEERQIQNGGFRKIDRQKSLQHERKARRQNDRARAKLMNFNVQFAAANVEGVVHGLSGEAGLVAAAEGAAAGEVAEFVSRESFFISNGFIVSSTNTSSRRSRFAAGRTRICLNVLPGLMSAIVPTGKSRGKMRSMPLVTMRSPGFTLLSSLEMYFMTSSGSPVPPTGFWTRESTSIAPTPLSLSVSSRTCAVSL